ncbi:MAG: bifunctional glutamate N-acetyltransferase/amino-acid acetyltransferase ArgJ, partial [Proteobacteria bacterium]|nr:bifunctional glutamate N-acetyltransferase/amino-acid acetyltransferase ArgJ [Pseudomonadota bacterium]
MAHGAKVSPFAPASLPDVPAIDGVRFASIEAGIRYKGRRDLMAAVMDAGTTAAGVLTQSKTCSAPVLWCRDSLKGGQARILVVNSGNANAFTGKKGRAAVELTAKFACEAAGCAPSEVYLASTGVIGEPLEAEKFAHLLGGLVKSATPGAWHDTARAIMTTDTFPKLASRKARIGNTEVTINGFCKGAGMIAPDMATMLCFLFTDAAVSHAALQDIVASGAATSFNCMTVDGDTSTSDTCLMFATGAAAKRGQTRVERAGDPALADFRAKTHELLRELAIMVAKDGEGVSKFVTIEIEGAESDKAARTIGLSIANSPLVKTAIAGEDPNWGRIVMAVGKAGEAADRDHISIWFGDKIVARDGERAAEYHEPTMAQYMKGREIKIRVDVGAGGKGRATIWT